MSNLSQRSLLVVMAAAIALALCLNALYTTWAVRSELHQSCTLLEAQIRSAFYPAVLHQDFIALANQRGC